MSMPIPGFVKGSSGELIHYNSFFHDLADSLGLNPEQLAHTISGSDSEILQLGDDLYGFKQHEFETANGMQVSYAIWPVPNSTKVAQELRSQTRKRLNRLEDILEAVPDLIYVINEAGIYLGCRAHDERDLPMPVDQIVGSSFWDMPESDDLKNKVWQLILTAIRTGKSQTIEYERKNKFGHLHFYEARISKSGADTAVYMVRNITERIVAQKELASSELKWKSIVENGYDSIILLNRDGRIRYASSHSKAIFGLSPSKMMETPAIQLLPQYTIKLTRLYYQLLEGKKTSATLKISLKDQYEKPIHLESSWISRLDDPHINAIIINFRDITKQVEFEKSLKKNQQTIETILQTTSAGILILEGTKIMFTNDQFADMLGYKNEELLHHDVSIVAHPDEHSSIGSRANKRAKGYTSQFHYKIKALTKSGEIRWLDVHSGSIQFNGVDSVIVTANDITEQHDFEEKLIEAKEGAEELARLKSSFLANMSHEIRTPLNGVLGLAELIAMSDNLDEIKEYVELQKDSGMRLLNTLTSILDLSRLEAENAQLELVPVNMNKLATDSYKLFKISFAKKGLNLHLEVSDETLICMGDETMLQQVITNLIGNALKFTEQGCCTVRVYAESGRNGEECVLEIEDTGIGISDEFLPHVFDTFRQELQGNSRKFEGSGLGLAISQKYLTLLNGSISVKSEKNSGSCFTLRIPLKTKSLSKN